MGFVRSVLAANLALLSTGLFIGWASPSVPQLLDAESPLLITESEASWVVAIPTFGTCVSALLSSILLQWIGRKGVLLSSAVPDIVGWLLCGFASTVQELYTARFLLGMAGGIRFATVPLYLAEIAPTKNRGECGMSMYLFLKCGTTLAYAAGAWLPARSLSLLSLTVPIVFALSFAGSPESPYYLTLRGKRDQARDCLARLRGTRDVEDELAMITEMVETDLRVNGNACDLITVPANRRAFLVVLFLVVADFATGSQTVAAYAQTIFDSVDTDFEGRYLTIVLGLLQIVSVLGIMFLVDRGGRKPLLLFSMSGVAACSFIISVYFYLQDNGRDVSRISWLTAVSVMVFTVSHAIGIAPIPHALIGELFAPSVKPQAAGFFVVFADLCTFVVLKSFYAVVRLGGLHTLFFIYTACDVLGILHVAAFVPETKRKTLKQVQEMFAGKEERVERDIVVATGRSAGKAGLEASRRD